VENVTEKKQLTISLNIEVKKVMPNLLWVLKARSTDKNRETLKYVLIEEGKFIATDGRRLHSWAAEIPAGLSDGVYDIIYSKENVTFVAMEGYTFPNYKQVIPDYKMAPAIINLEKSDEETVRITKAVIQIFKLTGYKTTTNIKFIKDLLGYTWEVTAQAEKAAKFTCGNLMAIVMPLRLEI
jgi:hypothetical protein